MLAKETPVSLAKADAKDTETIGNMMVAAVKVANTLKLSDGYRIVVNNGKNAC